MSPILTLQQRLTEVGRIRLGERVQRGAKLVPTRLDHFRLTSPSREKVESAQRTYGGKVEPWKSDTGKQWQLIVEAEALDVLVAPGESFSQWYELWKGGGCERRCDGLNLETLRGRDVRDKREACLCPADPVEKVELAAKGEACKPTTRLAVWLPHLEGIGVWRAETHGFYAAAELPNAVGLLQGLAAQGYRPIARLRISTRQVKRPGQPTKTFPVLELDVPSMSIAGMLAEGVRIPGQAGGMPLIDAGNGNIALLEDGNIVTQGSVYGERPRRGERVARPGPGTPYDPPAGSDMRQPAPLPPASSPVDPGAISAPYAGADDDEDERIRTDEQLPAIAGQETLGFDSGLTTAQFRAMAQASGISDDAIAAKGRQMFGENRRLSGLSDDERGQLLDAALQVKLAEEAAQAAEGDDDATTAGEGGPDGDGRAADREP